MTLREKILKTFVVTIREVNTHGGPEAFFEKYPVGGIYYSEEAMLLDEDGREMGSAMTFESLQRCKAASKNKLLVCADQTFIKGQKMLDNSQRSLGATDSEEAAYNFGKIIGMQMNSNGVDWVLAPSIDMYFSPVMPLMAISDDPEHIAKVYRQVIRGIQDQGVCATVKHFPGVGTTNINMHLAPSDNILPFDEWMDTYGYTYKQMFEENAMSVMTTHVALKSFDNEFTDGYYPVATFSHKLTTELLKEKLGFEGAVVTDALIMGGMATGDIVAETVQAFKAGADLLLWPPIEAADKIEEAIKSGDIPMSRLEDALSRIEKMEAFRNKALAGKAYDEPDCGFADKAMLDIEEKGICLLRNNIDLLPLKGECKKILVVDATDIEGDKSSYMLCDELKKRGFDAEVKRDIYDVPSLVVWQSEVDAIQKDYDLVIFNLNANYIASWTVPMMLIWASHLFDKKKKLIVNYGSPFFARDYFPEDPTIIEMNCVPSAAIIEKLVDKMQGMSEFEGKCVLKSKEV
ncbi:MAG: hypothetical protein J6C82_05645 [Clostridia bacterium]|nr:hypothetical protein [Clostridia bacterium]MBP3359599.1 hypothetical protein [Clostridia bacterium]